MESRKRKDTLAALRSYGWGITESWDFINKPSAKTSVFLHKPALNVQGEVQSRVGTIIGNQPASPDHAMRLSRMGRLPWEPSQQCKCKACRERDWTKTEEVVDGVTLPLYVSLGENPPLVSEVADQLAEEVVAHANNEVETVQVTPHIHSFDKEAGSLCKFHGCIEVRKVSAGL